MGFHVCEYCKAANIEPAHSSGDIILKFDNGHVYEVPDMIVHYVLEHEYMPPIEFVEDVLRHNVVGGERWQAKSASDPTKIGYLKYPEPPNTQYAPGALDWPDDRWQFLKKLVKKMRQSASMGHRRQTIGINVEHKQG